MIVIGPRPGGQKAEENMAGGLDNNSHMSAPHDQVAGLRLRDTAKSLNSVVEIVGTRIDVGEASAPVDGMNKVGTVVGGIAPHFGAERDCDH